MITFLFCMQLSLGSRHFFYFITALWVSSVEVFAFGFGTVKLLPVSLPYAL
jgi:hypothetical protein